MIDVKDAVQRAMQYLEEMYDTRSFRDVLLEEVDRSEDDRFWNVTIGFTRPQEPTSAGPMAILVGQQEEFRREYRVFQIDAEKGALHSMRSRKAD